VPVTSNDVANEALMQMGGNQPRVTGNAPTFDDSTAGKALRELYSPCVQIVGRQFGWDFARALVALALSGNVAPFPWALEYLYPTGGVQVWQLMPATLADVNNPVPVNWSVGNAVVTGTQKKVIWTDLASARAAYNNNPTEDTWDAGFREAVVRLLASELALAIGGKPDAAQVLLQSGGAFEKIAEGRDS
jgi:hypothetical protein